MNSNLTRYYFTEEHELFRQSLRKFLEKEVLPHIDQWEAQEQVPRELWRKFAEQGFLGFHYPPEYGGANLDFFYTVVFTEEISRVFSGGFGVIPLVTQYMSTPYIYKYGSESLRQKYLPPVIRGEKIAAIGISEPGAGSDVANIQTKAIREGDWYVVSGQKTFISNGDSSLREVLELLRKRVEGPPIGVRIGLKLGSHQLVLDGTGQHNQIIEGPADAPCTLQVEPADLQALLSGQLNPMNAFLSGKVRVHGDMNVALQLQRLFGG